jgi:hypothetical protein
MHNPNTSRTNTMGGLVAGMHKTNLLSACGHTPPDCHPQQQQLPQQRLPIAYYSPEGTAWQQPTPPMQFGRMRLANGTYCQQRTMAMLVYQPSQGMMMNVRQYTPAAGNVPMMQMGQQPMVVPMMMSYYAPNQQPNQQPGYF